MSGIFISYASSDRARVQVLAKALEQQGWSVWWDRTIPPGRTFDQVIEEALDTAKCVIVVWSRDSVKSEWVKDEADEGKRRGILVPVLIDEVEIPLGFRRIQAAWFVDWQGTSPHQGFDQLLKSIAEILGHSPDNIQKQETEGKKQEKIIRVADKPRKWFKIAAGAGIIAVIIAILYVRYRQRESGPAGAGRIVCIQNMYLASQDQESYLSDAIPKFWGGCSKGEKWQIIPSGDAYCIQNVHTGKYLSDNVSVLFDRCSTGEKWRIE